MRGGYYKMRRGWQDHEIFAGEAYSRRDAWEWLISKAAYRAMDIWVNGEPVTLQPGQLCYAYRYLATAWGWSIHRVQNFIGLLKKGTMIETATDTGRLLITICNYKKYQIVEGDADTPDDTLSDTARVRDGYATDTNKKEIKENITNSAQAKPRKRKAVEHPRFAECWPLFPKRDTPQPRSVASERFTRAVQDGASPDDIIRGLRGYADHCRKAGKLGTSYVLGVRRFFDERTWEGYLSATAEPRARPSTTDPDFLTSNPELKGQAA